MLNDPCVCMRVHMCVFLVLSVCTLSRASPYMYIRECPNDVPDFSRSSDQDFSGKR